ncbi:hypothetical protein KC332_g12612 [Hortaea werneckii]|uniref:Uncharacterized protein n=2 Tax=Hortaea werneckii TaxID=91943 RepID=A0A3M7IWL7_HORWE|nr:hypothetical protein KC358_g16670 [Hortaea werneckii]OTA28057.1 hypothetical protein BTJ68_10843 [Hortaea werneckii EXF-2000]KAI6811506.1 hypothetical protein KC350_g12202 [Hortaea werneckii]KAI6907236.1 hypothetical protein KC348_g14314 [Hortaea werneckii]KAI6922964.1 hypothetical protein KC341_g15058 [Hortaea werneckii]
MANDKDNKYFSFETVATIVAALQSQGKSLGNREYALMAELDGTRTASSFEHSFRAVKKRAQEISKKGASKDGGKTSAEKPMPRKRAKAGSNGGMLHASKTGTKEAGKCKGNSDGNAEPCDEESPAKKVKQEDMSEGISYFSDALGDVI